MTIPDCQHLWFERRTELLSPLTSPFASKLPVVDRV
jgi:hypothetical protein